jgi:hypothetical protein
MVVRDLDLERIPGVPPEADAPLVVDSDAVLPGAVSDEPLEAVAGWHAQVREVHGRVQLAQLAERHPLDARRETPCRLSLEEPSGFPVPKAPNHVIIVTRRVIIRKRLWRGLTDSRISCTARTRTVQPHQPGSAFPGEPAARAQWQLHALVRPHR